MRAFVAFEPPERVREEILDRLGGWRAAAPPARWVRAAGWHLTLVFLGEVPERELEPLVDRLGAVFARRREIELAVRGAGVFPPRGAARVAWLGVADRPAGALAALHRDLLAALADPAAPASARAAAGQASRRPFHAHLTLARCRPPWPRRAAESFVAAADGFAPQPFRARRGVLYESRLSSAGATYREIDSFALDAW